jgi:hypothetical protein
MKDNIKTQRIKHQKKTKGSEVMSVRILHCGKSIENYNLCAEHKVAGFTKRYAEKGDTVYIAVKSDNATICGVRGVLTEATLDKPWKDYDRYIQAFKMSDVEYCKPFDLTILAEAGGRHWVLKYIQNSKAIKDQGAIVLLDEAFTLNKQATFEKLHQANYDSGDDAVEDDEINEDGTGDAAVSQEPIEIMGTFETVRFVNETDQYMGLERSVNDHFYDLFPDLPQGKTILIKENKMFKTSGMAASESKSVTGIQGIPDGLLIKYSKGDKIPFKIILIEYECYGESKIKSIDKFNYLNGHIIPQLMRFASTFSIATDRQIREQTIKSWIDKIINYIWQDPAVVDKVKSWILELDSGVKQEQIAYKLNSLLEESFKSNLGIMLIIDELTYEQRDTIKNIIGSFRLENGSSIAFYGYVVRLEQKICIINDKEEYALSIQQYY